MGHANFLERLTAATSIMPAHKSPGRRRVLKVFLLCRRTFSRYLERLHPRHFHFQSEYLGELGD